MPGKMLTPSGIIDAERDIERGAYLVHGNVNAMHERLAPKVGRQGEIAIGDQTRLCVAVCRDGHRLMKQLSVDGARRNADEKRADECRCARTCDFLNVHCFLPAEVIYPPGVFHRLLTGSQLAFV